MPRLNSNTQNIVENAQETNFGPLPAGKYIARLSKVEARYSQAGNPLWSCEYDDLRTLAGDKAPGRLWYSLNLPIDGTMPAGYQPRNSSRSPREAWEARQNIAAGQIKAWFHAHGFTLDSDTDEMIGTHAVLTVTQETIQRGQRAGQIGNRVTAAEAAPEGTTPAPTKGNSPWGGNDAF